MTTVWCFTFISFREREDQIQKLSEVQKQQAQQAEHALEDFKSQVERNSGRMFDEMKAQVYLNKSIFYECILAPAWKKRKKENICSSC